MILYSHGGFASILDSQNTSQYLSMFSNMLPFYHHSFTQALEAYNNNYVKINWSVCGGGVCASARIHVHWCKGMSVTQYAYGNPRTIFGSHSTSGPQDWTQVVRRVQQVLLSPGSSCLYWKQGFLIWHVCIFTFLLSKKKKKTGVIPLSTNRLLRTRT